MLLFRTNSLPKIKTEAKPICGSRSGLNRRKSDGVKKIVLVGSMGGDVGKYLCFNLKFINIY